MRLLPLLVLLALDTAHAAPLWELQDTDNRVRLLGSIHFLRASDYPLPAAVERAFAEADVLVMELDLDDLDPLAAQAVMQELSVDPAGRTLGELIGPAELRRVRQTATEIGIDAALLEPFEPWYAALQITQLRLAQLGFDPAWGIEARLVQRAAQAGKPVDGLETMEAQLAALDGLPMRDQQVFLARTIDEAGELEPRLDEVMDAWRSGDVEALEATLLGDLESQAAVYESLLVARNRRFAEQIAALAGRDRDYLVIVGTLHLVGDDSVLSMLEEAGYPARQLRD